MGADTIAENLDRLYKYEMDKYVGELDFWKSKGYKVYRNSDGIHKVVEPPKKQEDYYGTDLNTAFGGIFNQIFNGK